MRQKKPSQRVHSKETRQDKTRQDPKPKRHLHVIACIKFTSTWLNVLQRMYLNMIKNMVANGALEKMSIGRVLVSVSTPHFLSLGIQVKPSVM